MMLSDEELQRELLERAEGLGVDTKHLINEMVKRYQIRKFEVEALTSGIPDMRRGEVFGYSVEGVVLVTEILRRQLIGEVELAQLVKDWKLMYIVILEMCKQNLRKEAGRVIGEVKFPDFDEVMETFLHRREKPQRPWD